MTGTGIAVILVQLGTPDVPDTDAVRRYLRQFLSDPRVVDLPAWWWKPLLHGVILRIRPSRSARLYRSIWREDGLSPLLFFTRQQARGVAERLRDVPVEVHYAMRYGEPDLAGLVRRLLDQGVERLLVFPLFPQYSAATTATIVDTVYAAMKPRRHLPALRIAAPFPDNPEYVQAMADRIRNCLTDEATGYGRPDHRLLYSFHGLPVRYVAEGDPYASHCQRTAEALSGQLGLDAGQWQLCFQSRFGREPWLTPATADLLTQLPAQGVHHVTVVCPGFVADCLETLEEIGHAGRKQFLSHGGETYHVVPCVNDQESWLDGLAALVRRELGGWL